MLTVNIHLQGDDPAELAALVRELLFGSHTDHNNHALAKQISAVNSELETVNSELAASLASVCLPDKEK